MKLKYNDYSNLPIGKYYEILDICNSDLSKIEKDLAVIAVLLDVTEDEVYKLKPEEVYELQQQLKFLSKPATGNSRKIKKINIAGKDYKVLSKLDELNIGQYVDFQFSWNNDHLDNLQEILSIFIIPEGCKYNEGYDIIEVQKAIKDNLSIEAALDIAFFLRRKLVDLIKSRLLYFRLVLWVMKIQMKDKKMRNWMKELIQKFKTLEKLLTDGQP